MIKQSIKSKCKMRKMVRSKITSKGINKRANMFFSIFMVVLLITELGTLAFFAAKKSEGINLKIGSIENNIETINSNIKAEEYFIKETAHYIRGDVLYNVFDSAGRDLSYIREYELNHELDDVINGNRNIDTISIGLDTGRCNFYKGNVLFTDIDEMDCFKEYNQVLDYFENEYSRYLEYYYDNNNENDIRNAFDYGLDYEDGNLVLFGLSEEIVKSISYSSSVEYENKVSINEDDAIKRK